MKNDQVRAELQLAKRCGGQNEELQKLNFLEAELPWLHRCEKKVWNVLSGLTNGDSCNFWFLPRPYSINNVYLNNPSVDF